MYMYSWCISIEHFSKQSFWGIQSSCIIYKSGFFSYFRIPCLLPRCMHPGWYWIWHENYFGDHLTWPTYKQKYDQIFVCRHCLFQEGNIFPRAKLEENCDLWGTDNVLGQISDHIFAVKWKLLCLLSLKSFSIFNTHSFKNRGYFPVLAGEYSVTSIDQSRASEGIWWIVKDNITYTFFCYSRYWASVSSTLYFFQQHTIDNIIAFFHMPENTMLQE